MVLTIEGGQTLQPTTSLSGGSLEMRNFTVIQGEKPEEKPFGLGPRPDYLKPRTYERALASEKLYKALVNVGGSASDLAQYAWFDRPPDARTP
jgi:hypothetical protein